MKKSRNTNQKGVTLVELLIYMGLLAILLVLLTDMMVSIMEIRTESEATTAVEQDGRFLLARIGYDIYRADAVTTPANSGDSTETLVLNTGGNSHTYSLNSSDLTLSTGGNSDKLNSSGSTVSNLSFLRLGNSIKVSFTVTSTTQRTQGYEVKNYSNTYALR